MSKLAGVQEFVRCGVRNARGHLKGLARVPADWFRSPPPLAAARSQRHPLAGREVQQCFQVLAWFYSFADAIDEHTLRSYCVDSTPGTAWTFGFTSRSRTARARPLGAIVSPGAVASPATREIAQSRTPSSRPRGGDAIFLPPIAPEKISQPRVSSESMTTSRMAFARRPQDVCSQARKSHRRPGLWWGVTGNMMLNHLAGHPAGIEHFFEQFAGPMTASWN